MSVKPVAWTPGPWYVRGREIRTVNARGIGEPIATAIRDEKSPAALEANACLIASAPELAEALQRMVDNCQDCDGEGTQFYADGRTASGGAFENHRPCPICTEGRQLLARITPK